MRRKTNSGMTFLELMLALLVVGLLATTLFPALATAKKKANRTRCMGNLRLTSVAFLGFANDNDARFPWLLGERDATQMWTSIYGDLHEGYHHCWDVRFLFLPPSIRQQLGSAEALASPCDPHAIAENAAEDEIGMFDKFGGRFDGAHFHMSRKAISYGVHLGGDALLPSTILATTRNVVGAPGYEHNYPAKRTAPVWNEYLGCSLRVADDSNQDQLYIGHDHHNFDHRVWHALGSLEASQGQMVFSDGSTRLMGNLRMKEAIYDHSKQTGGTMEEVNENLSRATQRGDVTDYFVK